MIKRNKVNILIAALMISVAGCGHRNTGSDVPATEKPTKEAYITEVPQPTGEEDISGATKVDASLDNITGIAVTEIPQPVIHEEVSITPAEPKNVSITITATGDCTLGTNQKQSYEDSFDDLYDSKGGAEYFFDNVRDIFNQDDMTIINLECSLTTSNEIQKKEWNMKGKPEYIDILTCSSIEAVSMGNNHRLDYGESGFEETVQLVEDADITYAYDDTVGVFETKGITIGMVSVNEHYDGTLVEQFLQDGIAELKEKDTDLIIACCHWGTEHTSKLDEYQMELGYQCIDWGADLVIGNHPHVLQAINEYKNKYIVYSLGNFCFGGNKNPEDKDTLIFQQTFTFSDGELVVDDDIRIIPCYISSVQSKNDYQPTIATDSSAERIIDKINQYSKDFYIEFDGDGYKKQ